MNIIDKQNLDLKISLIAFRTSEIVKNLRAAMQEMQGWIQDREKDDADKGALTGAHLAIVRECEASIRLSIESLLSAKRNFDTLPDQQSRKELWDSLVAVDDVRREAMAIARLLGDSRLKDVYNILSQGIETSKDDPNPKIGTKTALLQVDSILQDAEIQRTEFCHAAI